jgi:sulfur carrier protein
MKVNGETTTLAARTVAELLELQGIGAWTKFVAVAVNGRVVRRDAWATTALGADDEVEIIKPRQGG